MYIVIILGMHLLLAIGFMRYFFHIPSKTLIMEHITQMQTEIIGNQGANNHSG